VVPVGERVLHVVRLRQRSEFDGHVILNSCQASAPVNAGVGSVASDGGEKTSFASGSIVTGAASAALDVEPGVSPHELAATNTPAERTAPRHAHASLP
jgi:hypothetical protein